MIIDPTTVECPACGGYGFLPPAHRMGSTEDCPDCEGSGFRPMTQDEINDAAADAWSELCSGEPPITMQERHEAAWRQKQELRS